MKDYLNKFVTVTETNGTVHMATLEAVYDTTSPLGAGILITNGLTRNVFIPIDLVSEVELVK